MVVLIKRYIPIIIIFIATCLFFGKALLPSSTQILGSGDIKHIHYPYREFLRNSILSGQIPFWNPYIFAGLPFLAHPYTAFAYPTTLPLLFLPSRLYFSIIPALHVFIAAVSMYYLLKKFADSYAALTSAIIFAFSGFFAARIYAGHIDYITSASLIPAIFFACYKYIFENEKKALFWGSIVLAFQITTGLINMVFYTFFIVFIFSILCHPPLADLSNGSRIKSGMTENLLNIFIKIFLFFIFGFGLSAIYLFPSFQFVSQTIRGTRLAYDLTSLGSANWQSLSLFLNPQILGSDFLPNNPFHGPVPNYHEHLYFVGVTPLIIIALFIIHSVILRLDRRIHINKKVWIPAFTGMTMYNRKTIALLVITLIALLISLGPNLPINLHLILWKILPIYQTTRFPVRHLVIAVFSLAFLTGLTVTQLRSKYLKILLLLIVTFELFSFGKKFIFLSPSPKLIAEDDQVIRKIIKDKELVRILPDFTLNSPVREKVSFASPLIYKYFSTSGYTPAILSSYYEFIDRVNGNVMPSLRLFNSEIVPSFPYLPAISFLNTKYIIVDNTADLPTEKKEAYQLLSETPLYRIYQAKNYLPRFFFVPEATIYKNSLEVANNLNRDQQDFQNKILLTTADAKNITYQPDCANQTAAKIDVVRYELNKIVLKVDFPCNGFLATSESHFPGWKAEIDGKNAPIITANLSFRALNIPKGTHTITFYYQPTIFYVGGIITLLSLSTLVYYYKFKSK